EALESAGHAPDKLAGSKAGVFVGISSVDYSRVIQQYEDAIEGINAYVSTGNALSIAANRISYMFDLRGPSVAVDTACSSSSVAVHLACQSLRNGESSMALVGGVNIILSPEVTVAFSHAHMMAANGRCKTFDSRADGYVRGEGCGVVVLKRLSDALKDGDTVLAVIRGSAVNQDGRTAGIAAPSGEAQQTVIADALAQAGVSAEELSYLEVHGTGTAMGDPIEVAAITAVLGPAKPGDSSCWLGSVKTNIGHLEPASGIAGLIKVVLCLQHRSIPSQLHFKELNPKISIAGTRIAIPLTLQPWPNGNGCRLAGVSSFGFGGTNAHFIVQEAPRRRSSRRIQRERPAHVLALSAKSPTALHGLVNRYVQHLTSHAEISVPDLCYTANGGRSHFGHRLAVVCENQEQLRCRLESFLAERSDSGVQTAQVQQKRGPRVAFLFP